MERANVRELKAHASEILRRVREEGATYEITHRGKLAARLVPAQEEERKPLVLAGLWSSLLTEEQFAQLDRAIDEVRQEVNADLERLYQELKPESAREP